jgi:hypothetical protein
MPTDNQHQMQLRYLMTIVVHADPARPLGAFPLGERRLTTFTGGTFQGAEEADLQGILAEGGVDWQTVRSDGAVELRARYALLTDRDEAIEVQSDGLRVMPSDAAEPAYFRTQIRLSTAAPRLAHLNNRIAVSTGERLDDAVHIHIHEVL